MFKRAHYYYAPTFFLSEHKNDYTVALNWCTKLEQNYQVTCATGVGELAIKFNIAEPEKVEALCMSGSVVLTPFCIDGMIGLYMNHLDSVAGGKSCAQV